MFTWAGDLAGYAARAALLNPSDGRTDANPYDEVGDDGPP